MEGMGEEKYYFHPFNSVKRQKAPLRQSVATNFVTDCSLSAFYRPLAWQNKIMGSSFLAIYAAIFHTPCLISASKEDLCVTAGFGDRWRYFSAPKVT